MKKGKGETSDNQKNRQVGTRTGWGEVTITKHSVGIARNQSKGWINLN